MYNIHLRAYRYLGLGFYTASVHISKLSYSSVFIPDSVLIHLKGPFLPKPLLLEHAFSPINIRFSCVTDFWPV